jgi:hypothetical protein
MDTDLIRQAGGERAFYQHARFCVYVAEKAPNTCSTQHLFWNQTVNMIYNFQNI